MFSEKCYHTYWLMLTWNKCIWNEIYRHRSRQPRNGFCFATIGIHLSALAFIMSVFLNWQTWPIETPCFLHCIFPSFCLQMNDNFPSISSTIPLKAIPWEIFLIWDKKTTKSLQNSIRFSMTCMSELPYRYLYLYPYTFETSLILLRRRRPSNWGAVGLY